MTLIDPYLDKFKDYIKTNDYVLPECYRDKIELVQVHQHPNTKQLAVEINILDEILANDLPTQNFIMVRKIIENDVIQSIRQEKYLVRNVSGSFIKKKKIIELTLTTEIKSPMFNKGYPYV